MISSKFPATMSADKWHLSGTHIVLSSQRQTVTVVNIGFKKKKKELISKFQIMIWSLRGKEARVAYGVLRSFRMRTLYGINFGLKN